MKLTMNFNSLIVSMYSLQQENIKAVVHDQKMTLLPTWL